LAVDVTWPSGKRSAAPTWRHQSTLSPARASAISASSSAPASRAAAGRSSATLRVLSQRRKTVS
jgi:hypothetical protein